MARYGKTAFDLSELTQDCYLTTLQVTFRNLQKRNPFATDRLLLRRTETTDG